MTTQAPTEATLDRITAMTPHQIAQEYTGRARIAAAAAADHAQKARAIADCPADRDIAQSAECYAATAEMRARDAIQCAAFGLSDAVGPDARRDFLHRASNHARAASLTADAVRTMRHAIQLAHEARIY